MSNFLISSAMKLGSLFQKEGVQEEGAPPQPVPERAAQSPAADDPYYETRLALVAQINRDRAANGVGPVEFDLLSSQVGDLHCPQIDRLSMDVIQPTTEKT